MSHLRAAATEAVGMTDPDGMAEYSNPAAVLYIPVEADLPVIREIIDDGYDTVSDEYERRDDPGGRVLRKGSLCQELLGQLNAQEGDDQ